MYMASLRKVGGSVMLAVPPVLLEQLQLQAGNSVGMVVTDDGRLLIDPKPKPRYTLAELLAVSDYAQPRSPEEQAWLDAPAVGAELL